MDEDDVRVRAGRGSRPRTRRRPAHAEAIDGFVTAVDRGRYRLVIGDRVVSAMKARELGRGNIVVGDTVSLAGDASGAPGTLARVVRIAPRRSVLRRSADDTDPVERAIVANADQLVIVSALADPPPRLRLIDRFLVAAYDAGIEPVLCLTKADLAGPEAILPVYEPLGDAARAVGEVNPVTGRGRHTSSSAVALPYPGGGWIIDTPGLRSFGLGHMSPQRVVQAFPDLAAGAEQCPTGCDHQGTQCALDDWVAAAGGGPLAARLDSLRRLLRSREGTEAD